jgi:hypothetical protein
MITSDLEPKWQTAAILIGRLIFAGAFLMAVSFKFAGMQATADYISAAGFPFSYPLAWLAAIFESVLVICFLTGAFFSEACLLAGLYVIFLARPTGLETRLSSGSLWIISPFSRASCLPPHMDRAVFWHCGIRSLENPETRPVSTSN